MEIQRVILLFALAFILLLLYQRWLEEQTPAPVSSPQSTGATSTAVPPPADIPETPSGVDIPTVTGAPAPAVESAGITPAGRSIVVETDLLRVTINPVGGGIDQLDLLRYPVTVEQPDSPFTLLENSGSKVFTTQSGLIGKDREYPNHRTPYRAEQREYRLKDGEGRLEVRLYWDAPDGVVYTKVFTFSRDSYDVDIEYRVDNKSATDWSGFLYGQFLRTQVVNSRGGFLLDVVPSYLGGAIYTPEEKFEKVDFSDMTDADLNRKVDSGWVSMLQHYFVGAWFPQGEGPYRLYTKVTQDVGGPRYNIGYNTLRPAAAAAGSTTSLSTKLYLGPKEQDRLNQKPEGFTLTVDYGWLTPVSAPLFWVLRQIFSVVQNWGWAIILLTCMIKLIFYPLSAASYKSMAKMKKLQPRLKTLKERYGDDKAKLNAAMMEMYKKDKVNPLGGCLPIVIQIPVFIALYWVLLESVELRQADFLLWINDLSVKDPYYVLPIAMGASMLGQQLLNPSPLDPIQQKIMMAMPIVFTFLFLTFPAGLVLYWLVNNVLSIAQQWYINSRVIGKT